MSGRRNNKIIQFNKNGNVEHVNVAVVIFAVIFIYVLVSIVRSLTKEPISIYKVSDSNINNNISCTGIALRSETEVHSTKSGYSCYYVRDGEKVRKGATVCTVDETGNIADSLSSSLVGTDIFTDEDYNDIRSTISLYKTDYSDEAFYEVYNFKSNIDSKVLELSNELLMQQVSESSDTVKAGLENVTSPESGIITYYVDGFEAVTPDSLTEDMFNKSDYQKTTLKTGEIVNSSTTLFKLIDEEDWNIVCQIDYDQANLLLEESRVTFTINNSNYEITAPFELIQKENSYFLNISLSKYMTDYIDERYLSIEIILDKYEGLKIPNTAIVEKNVYKLPVAYIAKGGNEDEEDKVYVQRLDENGEVTVEKIDLDIYKTGDDYYLVNPDSFADTDVIVQMDTNDTISVSLLSSEKVQGVYIANKGIADFTEITVVKAGDEFTIVSDEDKLREFDNIIMDSSQVIENQIIY